MHEINSEKSTVALEKVSSFGTEGRRGGGEDEIGPSDQTYDYIEFRGSDVKDLRIEEPPQEPKPAPQVPNDPAILGVSQISSVESPFNDLPVTIFLPMVMKHIGCKFQYPPRAQNRVDISVAFLLIF